MVTPSAIAWGTAGFLAALLLHIITWRWRKPPREMMWLVIIFILLPGLAYAGILIVNWRAASPAVFPDNLGWKLLISFIWLGALSSAYIMTYPPIQAGCPSLKIVLEVHRNRPGGMTVEEINGLFPREAMFSDRFDDLVEDGLVSWEYDAWGITGTGRLVARFFLAYRRILKLPIGEG